MKAIITILTIVSALNVSAKETYTLNGKEVSKKEATAALYTTKGAKVVRISDMKLSDKTGSLAVDKK